LSSSAWLLAAGLNRHCSLRTIPCSLRHLSNLLFPLGAFSLDTFFLFRVSVFNVCVLGQMLLLASDTSVPRRCGQLGAAVTLQNPDHNPCKGSCKGMPQPPSTSDELQDQRTGTKHLLPLAQPILVSSGSSFSAGRGRKQPLVDVLT